MKPHLLHRPGCIRLSLLALLILILTASCSGDTALSLYLEANRANLDSALALEARPTTFVVQPGSPAKLIGEELERGGIIGDSLLFEAFVRTNGLAHRLEAGTFTLSPDMTIPEIAEALQNAIAPGVTVVVRPGMRLEETADMLDRGGLVSGEEYRNGASTADLSSLPAESRQDYTFLQFHPAGQSLEGYLLPDSYQLSAEDASAADLLQAQLDAFESRVMPLYWDAVARGVAMDLHDVLTVASIVEREAVVDEEREMIAGVYLNRLTAGMRLEADPTVQYAMGFQPASGQWWKSPVSLDEYSQVDSPYNTYLHSGLPPGPIAAVRMRSIEAVLAPAEHDFLFFVAEPGGTGRHVFSRTFGEHLEAVERFRRGF